MPKKRFKAEQIVTLLRQIEVLMAQGKSAPEACRDAGVSQQSSAMSCSTAKSSTA
jgi:putative transposase